MLVKAAARDAEGVTLVTDMNARVGSEDCTMLIRRIQAHGGKCAFFYFGCDHHGHHRPDFEIRDRTSLPVGRGVFTGFVARTNARCHPSRLNDRRPAGIKVPASLLLK